MKKTITPPIIKTNENIRKFAAISTKSIETFLIILRKEPNRKGECCNFNKNKLDALTMEKQVAIKKKIFSICRDKKYTHKPEIPITKNQEKGKYLFKILDMPSMIIL